MQTRESEIHFYRWIFDRKENNWLNVALFSLALHILFFFLLTQLKPKEEVIADQSSSSIKINFSTPQINQKLASKKNKKFTKKREILTSPNSQSEAYTTPQLHPEKQDLNSFLPKNNSNYLSNLRRQNQIQKNNIQGDDGDLPIDGPSLAPTNGPRIISRYAEKDMSLFQFTQEFRERFGAIWNSEDRVVPPTSPLRPGDIVYYKIYINTNGSMEKFENLSRKDHPKKDYTDIDKLFTQVITRVLPMSVPPKFAHKNITLSEVIAIQVVDRNMPVKFSF
ncbi:MAG: hypothetical protein V4591_00815 [Bdellovibrionota bacterium]